MFAIRLKNLRQSKQLSQSKLAPKIGVKKQSVCNWENGNIMPSVDMLVKIADFFEVSTDYLLGRNAPQEGAPNVLDVTGLTPEQIEHIELIVDDLRKDEI